MQPMTEDIAQDPEPQAASNPPAPQPPMLKGHHPAIHSAVTALRAANRLPHHLRPGQRDRVILAWLKTNGYGDDLPTRWAIRRFFLPSAR